MHSREAAPARTRFGLKRRLITAAGVLMLCAIVLTLRFLLAPDVLTPEEARFTGTYSLLDPGAAAQTTLISFQSDRACVYRVNGRPIIGLETDWQLEHGELRMSNHYRVAPFSGGPLLPGARQTETVIWRLVPTSDPKVYALTTPDGLPIGTLTRRE